MARVLAAQHATPAAPAAPAVAGQSWTAGGLAAEQKIRRHQELQGPPGNTPDAHSATVGYAGWMDLVVSKTHLSDHELWQHWSKEKSTPDSVNVPSLEHTVSHAKLFNTMSVRLPFFWQIFPQHGKLMETGGVFRQDKLWCDSEPASGEGFGVWAFHARSLHPGLAGLGSTEQVYFRHPRPW